jgi:polyhydroxyalkanoate synthesis regulator phasin
MLNDEINVTTGLEEIIYTEMPEESVTDFSKADKTDRRINETYLIVDKQNQEIESVISNVTEQDQKIATISQTVEELNSKISDIADITVSQETNNASLTFTDINQSEPIRIEIHPIVTNISYLYPRANLYPSDLQYLPDRKIRFTNTTTSEVVDYEIPADLLYYDSNNYDEFILDYDSQSCVINKKVGYNADGTTYVLSTPTTISYTYPQILLNDGDYTVELVGYSIGYMMVRLMAQNIYTTQFATKAELTSSITQTRDAIELEVSEKLDEEDFTSANILLKINDDTSSATINADKINLNGVVTANSNFKINTDGSMEAKNGTFTGGKITLYESSGNADFTVQTNDGSKYVAIFPNNIFIETTNGGLYINSTTGMHRAYLFNDSFDPQLYLNGNGDTRVKSSGITTPEVIQTSKEEDKKNFEKLNKGLDIIKNIDIYKYNLKLENDDEKKHIGFVIGDKYNYSKEVTSKNNDGVDIYSFVSVCCKAIQEQQEQIEELKEKINKLEGGR